MTDENVLLDALYRAGKSDAALLRTTAKDMTGTQIINQEHCIPLFDNKKDYSNWAVGSPVIDEEQVWILIQPHNAAHYDGRPSTLRALWGLCHTTEPSKAKSWVEPFGTSGLYMKNECYKDEERNVYKCLQDNMAYNALTLPQAWEKQ